MSKSQDIVIEAPLSFTGSAKRVFKLSDNIWIRLLLLVPLLGLIWSFIACWYLFFGILVIPYRLIRRGQRKQTRDNLRHEELLTAVGKGRK